MAMQPDDIIIFRNRRWMVTGVFHGAEGGESVVGLRPVNLVYPSAYGQEIQEMFAPLALVQAFILDSPDAGCFRTVPV